jgi:hypothetical protein
MEDNGGALTPQAILRAASDPAHPLHTRFTWDDDEAARKYRLAEARALIRTVRVTYEDSRGEPQQVRVFHSVLRAGAARPVYETIERIAESEFDRQMLRRRMEADWKAFRRRYQHLDTYLSLLQAAIAEREGQAAANGTEG